MSIGFFDSGVGGLTVLELAMQQLQGEHFIYYADIDNVPYGTKTHTEIKSLVMEAVAFIVSKDIKALVIACNTATSVVVKELRKRYDFPIVGMEPAVKPAIEASTGKKILVCATDRTLNEDKLKHLIIDLNADDIITLLSLQQLVNFGEQFDFHSDNLMSYLHDRFRDIDWSLYHAIVLGCTHFIFYRNTIRKMIPDHVEVIDGNQGTVNRLISLIDKKENTLPPHRATCDFYISGREVSPLYFDHYMRFISESNIIL